MDDLLQINNLNIWYVGKKQRTHAVRNFSLRFKKNTSYGIVGESGSGKSTLALAILRLLERKNTEVSGEIIYENKDILKLSDREFQAYRWEHFATVFQSSLNALSPLHKIKDQFRDIYLAHFKNIEKARIDSEIREALTKVNLEEKAAEMYPHELSGGMIQRACIAMSLLLHPKVLIMDESTTALDLITENKILETIRKMEEKEPLTRLMITHDISIVAHNCERIAVMYGGYILEEGEVKEVLLSPKHPYTEALLSTFPSDGTGGKEIKSIEGRLPDLTKENEGCIFYERCKYRFSKCCKSQPKLHRVGLVRVACHRWESGNE